jgi:hypothetical protein
MRQRRIGKVFLTVAGVEVVPRGEFDSVIAEVTSIGVNAG